MPNSSSSPSTVTSTGVGTPWLSPSQATGSGTLDLNFAIILNITISGGIATFETSTQEFSAGIVVNISNVVHVPGLNGLSLTVLPTGLSSTGFQAAVALSDITQTQDTGLATPVNGIFTQATVPDTTVPANTGVVYVYPPPGGSGGTGFVGECGAPGSGGCAVMAGGIFISGGCQLNPQLQGSVPVSGFEIPTLPSGAVVTAIKPTVMGNITSSGSGGENTIQYYNSSVTEGPIVAGDFSGTVQSDAVTSTDWGQLTSSVFVYTTENTNECGVGQWAFTDAQVCMAVYYTAPTLPPPGILQTLTGTNFTFSVPADAVVTGITVTFDAGEIGTAGDSLTLQLAQNGTLVGTSQTVTLSDWATGATVGGESDLWGAVWTPALLNSTSGLSLLINGSVAAGSQVNLNSLAVSVHYVTGMADPVVWVSVGNSWTR